VIVPYSSAKSRFVITWLLFTRVAAADICPAEIHGGWEAEIPITALTEITIEIDRDQRGDYSARLLSANHEDAVAVWHGERRLRLQSEKFELSFEGSVSPAEERIDGFIVTASNLYRVTLGADRANHWSSTWRRLPDVAEFAKLDMYIDDDGSGGTGAYFFFRDDRYPSLYGLGATCAGQGIETREKTIGLTFRGSFDTEFSKLNLMVHGPGAESEVTFTRMSPDRRAIPPGSTERPARTRDEPGFSGKAPRFLNDGWRPARPQDQGVDVELLSALVASVSDGQWPNTHSILVSRNGSLVVEEYFHGFDESMLHDMRSASKSLASTLVGLAVDRQLISGSNAKVLSFFSKYRSFGSWDPRKTEITVQNLMTMSSGLDANDSDQQSVAAEWAYQSQTVQPDWTKFALDSPMIGQPGARLIYGGANPLILGGILDSVVGDRVEWFAEDALFAPLGIDQYRIYLDPIGVPYMGGGMYLRPRDMLKIGQMYLDDGRWNGRQVLSKSWVTESFGKYGQLEPLDRNGNQYGYLWWHETYDIGGRRISSVEARGNGGQYIFVIPELNAVVVITSGNYRGGLEMTRQPQRILEQFLLPALSE
jgi:CubicO group peptidase (beta-lactamase class C family)